MIAVRIGFGLRLRSFAPAAQAGARTPLADRYRYTARARLHRV
jgi:hypothetical protein